MADHELITAIVNLRKPKRVPTLKTFHDLCSYSCDTFRSLLWQEKNELNKIFVTDDIETHADMFTEYFTLCLNKCTPLITKAVRRLSAPWINYSIKVLISQRDNTQLHLKNIDITFSCKMNITF